MEPAQLQNLLTEFTDKTGKTVQHLLDQLRTIRTGRASPALVDTIKVEYYGTLTPLNQMAHISVPEPRQLLVKPFDATAIKEIERAIQKSDLGLNPATDGKVVRLTMPPLSEEQRKKLAAKVRDIAEQSRVALRNERREVNKKVDALKNHGLTEDQVKKVHDKVQDTLKNAEHQVDEILKKKTAEIMET